MGISNSQSTGISLNNLVFPIWLDEIVCAAMLAYPHEQRICWSCVRKWTGKRFGERCAEFWNRPCGRWPKEFPLHHSRILQDNKDAVSDWLDRGATPQCRLSVLYLWDQLHVTDCQLNELWSFVHPKEDLFLMVQIDRETDGDAWIWVVFFPVWRLILVFGVSKRSQDSADLLVDRVTAH